MQAFGLDFKIYFVGLCLNNSEAEFKKMLKKIELCAPVIDCTSLWCPLLVIA